MNLEKSCYSLLGCLAVGAIIQNNMNLHFEYFVGITLLLWVFCISMQRITNRRRDNANNLIENARKDIVNKQLEYLIDSISKMQSEQTSVVIETINELNGGFIEKFTSMNSELEKCNRCFSSGTENIQKEISQYSVAIENFKSTLLDNTENWGKRIYDIMVEYKKNLVEEVRNCNSDMNNICEKMQEYFEELNCAISELQTNYCSNTKKLIVSQDKNFAGLCTTINENEQHSLEMVESIKELLKSCKKDSDENCKVLLEDCKNEIITGIENHKSETLDACASVKKIIENVIAQLRELQISNAECFSTSVKDINECLEKIEVTTKERNESSSREIMAYIKRTIETIESGICLVNKEYAEKITILKSYLDEISNAQIDDRKSIQDKINALSDNVLGSISNVQGTIDNINNSVEDIQRINSDSLDKLDAVKGAISENKEECTEKISELTNVMGESADKQLEIISGESNILNQYDKLISFINDEVVVKIISDSDNLLKCIKDCYCLLESLRKVKK